MSSWAIAATKDLTEVSFSNSNYIRSGENYFGSEEKEENITSTSIAFKSENSKPSESSKVDMEVTHSIVESSSYINLREAYYDYAGYSKDLVIGRKLYNWSQSDSEWKLGVWQPMFQWDKMRPEENGLFGGFWEDRIQKGIKARVFVSPLHIPTMGPDYDKKDGRITSKNPWFRPPPPRMNFLETDTDIYARIESPDVSDVVFNPGVGGRIDVDISHRRSWGVAYAYKPMNPVFVSYDYKLRTASVNDGVQLNFFPWVGYHHLLTLDYTEKHRRSGMHLSLTQEKPTRLEQNEDLVYPQFPTSTTASFSIYRNLSGEGPSAFQIYGGLMRYWGGIAPDGGPAQTESSQFEIRSRYLGAFKAGMRYPVWNKYRRLMNRVEMNYDFVANGGIFLSELETELEKDLFVALRYDMIGMLGDSPNKYKNSFINTYHANDSVSARVSYVY